jgi:hypothetical protein
MNPVPPLAPGEETGRWGAPASLLIRAVAAVSWLSLVTHLLATALPGSRSGIDVWIKEATFASGLSAQTAALMGSSVLVLLVVGTLGERSLSYVYRLVVAPVGAVVLMLVMLGSTLTLEPMSSLALGVACLALATAGSSAALKLPVTRAQGLVLSLVVLGAAGRLATRIAWTSASGTDVVWAGHTAWVASAGHAFDAFGVALAAARLRSEQRGKAALALAVVLSATCVLAWAALRGTADGAATWQVIVSRMASELVASPVAFSTPASRVSVEAFSLLLAGALAFWPGTISSGMLSIALALTARAGADVPASALVLALGALAAPLALEEERAPVRVAVRPPRTPEREGAAEAEGPS